LREQRAALAVSANAPFLSEAATAAGHLWSSLIAVLGLIGLLYVGFKCVQREPAERMLLPAFATLWLVWFVGFSVGYQRYAMPFVAIACLFAAVLAHDVVRAVRPSLRLAVSLLIATPIGLGLAAQLRALAEPADTGALRMGTLIAQHVEPPASIESLEWELDVLTDRHFHHPPPFVPAIPYAVPSSTSYLVDGPASKATELYRDDLQQDPYDQVASAGQYDLYRRRAAR
jgi:hypothetical protein